MASLMSAVIGHENVKRSLLSMTAAKKFFGGSLFTGPDGVGKKKVALACLQELNCESSPACGECKICTSIVANSEQFLHFIEPQGTQIKIEQIRDTIHFLSLKSWVKHRFIIVDQAEKISVQATNALLKSLEEPPEGVHFVFVTANLAQILPTIRSRCQVVQFGSLSHEEMKRAVKDIESWQTHWSFGRPALALKIMDPEWLELRKTAINFLHSPYHPKVYADFLEQMKEPEKVEFILHCWMTYLRDAMLMSEGAQTHGLYNSDISAFVEKFSQRGHLADIFDEVTSFRRDYLGHVDKNLLLENFSIRLNG